MTLPPTSVAGVLVLVLALALGDVLHPLVAVRVALVLARSRVAAPVLVPVVVTAKQPIHSQGRLVVP